MATQSKSDLSTKSILESTSDRPLHLRPREQLVSHPVSSHSVWGDGRWVFDNPTKGAQVGQSIVIWHLMLPDDTNLTDPINADLLDWLKRLIWSAYAAPGDGAGPLKPGSLGTKSVSLRWCVQWLVARCIRWPQAITPAVVAKLVEELRFEAEEGSEDEANGLSEAVAWSRLNFFTIVWRQRIALERAGIAPMQTHPFDQAGVKSITKSIGAARLGQHVPLPDEVAIPLLNQAYWLLGTPAEDVLALQRACHVAYETLPGEPHHKGDGSSRYSRKKRQKNAARAFQFSKPTGSQSAWHTPLTVNVIKQVRKLVIAIQTAAVITIQSTTGMRISEICGLRAGIDDETGLPTGVTIEPSLSGLEDIFVLHSPLSKTEETPRIVQWTIGSCSAGSNNHPPALRALFILNKLLAPYRSLLGSKDLLLNIISRRGLPKTGAGVHRITAERLLLNMKEFAAEWIDLSQLPDESARKVADNDLVPYRESEGRCIKTHQLRKLFANFALRVDSKLLSALQMHFHHVSQAMTDGGYRMSDPSLLREIDDVRKQQMARLMLELVQDPEKHMTGYYGEQIESRIREQLTPKLINTTTKQAFVEIYSWVEDSNLHWYFEPHGICGAIAASEMACHRDGDSEMVARWRPQLTPNYAVRTPTVCAGCRSVIMAEQHLPFWRNRFVDSMAAALHYEREGLALDYNERALHLEKTRAYQARAICKKLGADLEDLDAQVESKIEELTLG